MKRALVTGATGAIGPAICRELARAGLHVIVHGNRRAEAAARLVAEIAAAGGAAEHVAFDVSEQLAITDAFLLASATNDRQVKAIVDEVEDKLREIGSKPIRREGERDGRWVLIDYGEIVVHVQHEEERQFYALERLCRDCPVVDLPLT